MDVHSQPIPCRLSLSNLTLSLLIFISVFAVFGALKYAYFVDTRVLVGPGSMRLFEPSSVFVKEMEVKDGGKKGVLVYTFSEKPTLSLEQNLNFSTLLNLHASEIKGLKFMWLNKGSRVHVKLESRTDSMLNNLKVCLAKGSYFFNFRNEILRDIKFVANTGEEKNKIMEGKIKVEYEIEEDDNYYVSVANTYKINNITVAVSLNVVSKIYDVTQGELCRIGFMFPKNKFFVVVSQSPSDVDDDGWYVELAFIARLVTYIAILGFVATVALIILRYFGACSSDTNDQNYNINTESTTILSETPLIQEKTYRVPYEDDDEGSSSSGEDLYDGKICVICYDMMRNCFFVPCGHCATCHGCALRIMEGETRVCPICRRLIHKVRKLLIP